MATLYKICTASRHSKVLAMVLCDLLLLPLSLWMAVGLRTQVWTLASVQPAWTYLLASATALPIFLKMGVYRAVVRYMGERAMLSIIAAVSTATAMFFGVTTLLHLQLPAGVAPIYWMTAMAAIASTRFVARCALRQMSGLDRGFRPVVIYGAGDAGRQLARALMKGRTCRPVAFIDDAETLHGLQILGLTVFPRTRLALVVKRFGVKQVLMAVPSMSTARRVGVVNELESLKVQVRFVPDLRDLISGKLQVSDLRDVEMDELLGRPVVPPNATLLSADIAGKSVMVTGAGGSIGSELCRQIACNQPRTIVLYELTEFALYSIHAELECKAKAENCGFEIVPVLGSVQDVNRLKDIMARYAVQTVYHAAAYKHVPLVEFNVSEGIRNNIFGTQAAVAAAVDSGIETFVMVSTDKAVRPTNVMGATKRMAEIVVQAYASDSAVNTKFSIVRFGNVLGSSGSVVPLFRRQIAAGGPVTVTHPDITRYFMTIPEAAQLVIQAGAMGGFGEVYVLDMGEPVKIVDLARRMVHLSGFAVRDEINPAGQIEIEFTGLRPGEKLYEELLIGGDVSRTEHPRVMKAKEAFLSRQQLSLVMYQLGISCANNDFVSLRGILKHCVAGFTPEREIHDHLYDANRALPARQSFARGTDWLEPAMATAG